MSVDRLLMAHALAGIPVGLLLGLAIALPARRDGGWGGYGSFRRRAARLGHIAAVGLPLLAGFYGLAIRALAPDAPLVVAGAWAWIAGGVLLPAALFAAAWRRPLLVLLPLPALAVAAGSVLLGWPLLEALLHGVEATP